MKKISIAFAGLGSRGKDAYLPAFLSLGMDIEVAAIADIVPEKVADVAARYQVPSNRCFSSAEEMLSHPKMADALCIATMDRQHVSQALQALRLGYDLLLEKPISPDLDECREIERVAAEEKRHVIVCHVLRYTPYYSTLKEKLDSGVIGDVVSIMAIENVGYWHQAHSFVRGNWRNCDETSPMILQKCCHDMDLYLWLANKRCHSISSFGSNFYFNAAHAPAGATDRCTSGCSAKKECPFDAEKIYLESPITGVCQGKTGWPCDVLTLHPDEKSIREAIETGPYGRCVFACDNNVVDHQVVNAQMTDGSTMSFTMCGLTTENTRYAKFMGTKGEIIANMHDNTIIISPFGKPSVTIDINKNQAAASGHGGGDLGLAQAFASLLNGSYTGTSLTSLDVSLESHYMALAAEQSRLCNGKSILISDMREPNK